MFGEGSRKLQDKFGGREIANRLVDVVESNEIADEYRSYFEQAEFFFLATSSGENTDCSFKGGPAGFVRIVAPNRLVFPDYDGNRMYKSLGNIIDNPNVGMLFMRFGPEEGEGERFLRVRVNGVATLHEEHELMNEFPGAKRMIEVQTKHVYLNCPRYIPHMEKVSSSKHIPESGKKQPVPKWKTRLDFIDALKGSS